MMMKNNFGAENWRDYIPNPVFDEHPEYNELYEKTWEIAFKHIKLIDGMPQNPCMDEAFCNTQFWIWDTCFMALFCKYAQDVFPGVESLQNFYEVLYGDKRLPTIIPDETEPVWTGAKAGEPYEIKVHIADNPPLFSWAEYQNALIKGDKEYLKDLLYNRKFLQKHYEWFENLKDSYTPDGVLTPTYLIAVDNGYKWEGGCSGMDNTPRGRMGNSTDVQRPNNPDLLWVDAICQQALSARIIAEMFLILGDSGNYEIWNEKFSQKAKIINDLYWDENDSFYYDIDCKTSDFYKVKTIASFWTLTSFAAPKDRAEEVAKQLLNNDTFGGKVPFVSLSRNDGDFSEKGKYWRGSVWLPTAYATLVGLKNYGFQSIAHETSKKLLSHMYKTYTDFTPHTIWECYSPNEYKPATNSKNNGLVRPDFCGWSALGPISIYIEYVLGFHTVDAFKNVIEWAKPDVKGKIGIKNLRFGEVITDIVADGNECRVVTNKSYTLEVNGKAYDISEGESMFII